MDNVEAQEVLSSVNTLLAERRFRNYVAQAHSRSILQRLGSDPAEWPNYSADLKATLLNTAHFLLWQGLQLRQIPNYLDSSDEFIRQGAEIIEFLFANTEGEHIEHLFSATLGYYICGHYARAYVLTHQVNINEDTPEEFRALYHFFTKDLNELRNLTFSAFNNILFTEQVTLSDMREGLINQDQALDRVLRISLLRVFSYFLEFPKSGNSTFLERARQILEEAITISQKARFVNWWWLLYCVQFLLDEYDQNSLWTVLSPFSDDGNNAEIVGKYIKSSYRREIPIIELWRSQIVALPKVIDSTRKSFCLRMPTSAGKTRIAELTILRFLLDTYNVERQKCLYIAPFRSLAVEIENSLKRSFHPLGFRVSELYGGFELSPAEKLLIDKTKVIIATPEKIDALLRYNPELADQIGLVVIDEGHIINDTERGTRFEIFLHRLVRRFVDDSIRKLFISAVLPDTEKFAEWITGDPNNVVDSDWRPSRLMLGELRWNGRMASIYYTHLKDAELEHECYVQSFIKPLHRSDFSDLSRRKSFPSDMNEVMADAALRFAQEDMTLVFIAQKRSVEPFGDQLLQALEIKQSASRQTGSEFVLPIKNKELLEECIDLAKELLGEDSRVINYLKAGIIVHHSDLPQKLRLKAENLVRNQVVKLVVATTTLAQGVNFPIRTVIVHSLYHGQNQPLNPLDFWNICGRAGRGMKENEGQVLFAVHNVENDPTYNPVHGLSKTKREQRSQILRKEENNKQTRRHLIEGYKTYRLISGLRIYIQKIMQAWSSIHPYVDVAELCLRLAENDISWIVDEDQKTELENLLDFLDAQILALIEEEDSDEITPDDLQEIMSRSLLILQLQDEIDDLAPSEAIQILYSRVESLYSRFPDRKQRRRFYQLGFRISDCAKIDNKQDIFTEFILKARDYYEWNVIERYSYLSELIAMLMQNIKELIPVEKNWVKKNWQELWKYVLVYWLQGEDLSEIVLHSDVKEYTDSPAEISHLIDDLFGYRVPWGLNALSSYLQNSITDFTVNFPDVASYFSSLIKYGVHSPAAASFLALGLENRKLALKLSLICPDESMSPEELFTWFIEFRPELYSQTLSPNEIETLQGVITEARSLTDIRFSSQNMVQFPIVTDFSGVQVGDAIVLTRMKESNSYKFYDLWGNVIGTSDSSHIPLVNGLSMSEIFVSVVEKEDFGDNTQLTLQFEQV